MKSRISNGLLLLSALMCFACGKKEGKDAGPASNTKALTTAADRRFDARKELRRSVKMNDTMALRAVIFENPDLSLNEPLDAGDDGDTLLTYAIKNRFSLIRNILLEKGASPNQRTLQVDYPGFTPLMLAAHMGDIATITALLSYKAEINAVDDLGDTALHKAIKNGYDEAAKTLIRAGCELDIVNSQGRTPLDVANYLGRKEIAVFLQGLVNLEAGAPTLAVFRQILADADVVNYRKLVSAHPEVIKEFSVVNPLAIVMSNDNVDSSFEIAQSLLMLKVQADGPGGSEVPPLIKATQLQRKNFVILLLSFQAQPDILDKDDHPALYYAIMNNDYDTADTLLTSGASKEIKGVFKACKLVDENLKNLKTPEDQFTNRRIQSRLRCRFLG